MKLCEFGCQKQALFQLKNGRSCCEENSNKCIAVRKRNSLGLIKAYKDKKRSYTYNPKSCWNRGTFGKINNNYFKLGVKPKNGQQLKRSILRNNLKKYQCEICNIISWNKKDIKLHIDHINGNKLDNRIKNLRFLCPNCHSQTDTYCRGKYKGNRVHKIVSDELLKKCYKESKTLLEALLMAGLTANNGNYVRIKRT